MIIHLLYVMKVVQVRYSEVRASIVIAAFLDGTSIRSIRLICGYINDNTVLICQELLSCERHSKIGIGNGARNPTVLHELGLSHTVKLTRVTEQPQRFAFKREL